MTTEDLANIAAALRQAGYEARNLGCVGITIWRDGEGRFLPAAELSRYAGAIARREFGALWRGAEGD